MSEIILNSQQEKARDAIIDWYYNSRSQIFVLSGYAGTGKTFLLNQVIRDSLDLDDTKVAFVAPTGKAATVLIQKGSPATTIHHLIYDVAEETVERELDDGTIKKEKRIKFVKKLQIPDLKLIVVDEVSMVPDDMLDDLLSFNIKIICTGDNAQLDPVSGYNTILKKPDITLTEIVRQAEGNPIIHIATMAREGRFIPYGNYGDSVFVIPQKQFNADREYRTDLMMNSSQIICGINRTRKNLNDEVRAMFGIDPLEQKFPMDGEKLICTQNNWNLFLDDDKKYNFVNGMIGYGTNFRKLADGISKIDFQPEFLDNITNNIYFDDGVFEGSDYKFPMHQKAARLHNGQISIRKNLPKTKNKSDLSSIELNDLLQLFKEKIQLDKNLEEEIMLNRFEFGYVISCHKSQGSEFDDVLVLDESFCFRDSRNNWLYTAITRAKNKLVIVR